MAAGGRGVVSSGIRTVLIVDDDPMVGSALQRGLKRRSITAVLGRTLAQGRALAHEHRPEACIVDFQLSGQESGLELVQDLRAQLRDTIIVLLSAYASMELGARAIKSGADHAIAKPVEIDEILRRLDGDYGEGAAECCTATDERVRWEHMQRVLTDCGGNRSETARRLGIDRATLQRWLARPPIR